MKAQSQHTDDELMDSNFERSLIYAILCISGQMSNRAREYVRDMKSNLTMMQLFAATTNL